MNAVTVNQQHTDPFANRDPWANSGAILPPAHIFARENEYVIQLEMPGVDKAGLEISLEGNELTVRGRPSQAEAPGRLIHCETSGCDYRRSFELSADVDSAHIRADLHQGLLCLHLPKMERAKPRKIAIE